MEGTFDYYGGSDVYFAFFNSTTLEELDNIPVKNNGLAFDETKSSCTNGATIEWNDELWAPKILNLTNAKTKCSLYFTNALTVTFDPDGGTLDTLTKEVAYNSSYGYLPTPTKAGYTFKGWNGKNLFNEESILLAIDDAIYENGYYIFEAMKAHEKYYYGITKLSDFKEKAQYTLAFVGHSTPHSDNQTNFRIVFKYADSTEQLLYIDADRIYEDRYKSIVSSLNKTIDYVYMTYGWGGTIYLSKVQLEEGDTATEWEPYFVTSDVKVTRNTNHTLKAIWEEN